MKRPFTNKAAAIADLVGGESAQVVAERYGLNPATVRAWKARIVPRLISPEMQQRATRHVVVQRAQLGDTIIALLIAKLAASKAIAEAVQNPAWLATQSGSELAALGQWLDSTAFALGDRLARRNQEG